MHRTTFAITLLVAGLGFSGLASAEGPGHRPGDRHPDRVVDVRSRDGSPGASHRPGRQLEVHYRGRDHRGHDNRRHGRDHRRDTHRPRDKHRSAWKPRHRHDHGRFGKHRHHDRHGAHRHPHRGVRPPVYRYGPPRHGHSGYGFNFYYQDARRAAIALAIGPGH